MPDTSLLRAAGEMAWTRVCVLDPARLHAYTAIVGYDVLRRMTLRWRNGYRFSHENESLLAAGDSSLLDTIQMVLSLAWTAAHRPKC